MRSRKDFCAGSSLVLSVVGAMAAMVPVSSYAASNVMREWSPAIGKSRQLAEPSLTSEAQSCELPTTQDLRSRRVDLELSFSEADIDSVVSQVVGEVLSYAYIVDPGVSGKVSLQIQGRHTPNEVLGLLNDALALSGNTLVVRADSILVTTLERARTSSGVVQHGGGQELPPGHITVTIPLRIARAAEINRLITSVAPRVSILFVDEARNLVLVAGAREDIQALQRVINVFDNAAALNLAYEVAPVRASDPDRLAGDVTRVLGRLQVASVELVAMRRLGSIVVIARSPEAMRIATDWIAVLDTERPERAADWQAYRPRYASAAHLAEVLGRLSASGEVQQAPRSSDTSTPPQRQGDNQFTVDSRTNTLIVRASQDDWPQILAMLNQIDAPSRQVLIEATIVEVTLNDELRFGLNWIISGGDGAATLSDNTNGAVTGRFPGFSYLYSGGDVVATLNALAARTNVQVMSSPRIVTLDGETATLQVGDEVPIVTQTAQSTQAADAPIVTSLEYRETGVILRVTPRTDGSGNIAIDVVQEVSDVARTTTSGIDSPTFQQRRIESRLSVMDGRTVVLGGLISSNESRGRTGVPLLRDVPVVGRLFSSTDNSARRTELLVFLTPRILTADQSAGDAASAARGMNELNERGLLQPP